MIRAAIDLGTNTFHLLIAETSENQIKRVLYQERLYVFLAENGLDHLTIDVIERAQSAVRHFKDVLSKYKVGSLNVVATEALRNAQNGPELSAQLEEILGSTIHIITGEQEAELIARSVQLAIPEKSWNAHVVDIGGGSTEVISMVNGEIESLDSKVCGIGFLYNRFHHQEPISKRALFDMRDYVKDCFEGYFQEVRTKGHQIDQLIGVAGSFEVLQGMSGGLNRLDGQTTFEIPIELPGDLLREIQNMNLTQRGFFPGLPRERKKYIVEALVIMDEILHMSNASQLLVCRYSIKHSLLFHNF